MDLVELTVADLNHDGMLDILDMVAFINGDRPDVDARLVVDGGSWFGSGNWATGERPGADTDVVIDVHVVVDQGGALAGTVSVASGGRLHLVNGGLTTALLTVHAGGVLQLDDASVLSVGALSLEAGSLLAWNGGLIEIAGGTLTLAEPDLLVGTTNALSSLSLIQGATATVGQDAIIGLGAGHAGPGRGRRRLGPARRTQHLRRLRRRGHAARDQRRPRRGSRRHARHAARQLRRGGRQRRRLHLDAHRRPGGRRTGRGPAHRRRRRHGAGRRR